MKEQFVIRPQAFPLVQNNWPTVGKSITMYSFLNFPEKFFITGVDYGWPNYFHIIWKKGISIEKGLLVVLKKDTGSYSSLTSRRVSPARYMAGYLFQHTPFITRKVYDPDTDEMLDYKQPAPSHTWGDYDGLVFCVVDIQEPGRKWQQVKNSMIALLDEALIQPVMIGE